MDLIHALLACTVMWQGLKFTKLTHYNALQDNVLLRDIFGLGAPLPVGPITDKASKTDRVSYYENVCRHFL